MGVTGGGAGAVLGIDQVNNAVVGGRFTPTLVPPEATLVTKHAGEVRVVAASYHARSRERRADVRIGPSIAAVGGLEHVVGVVVGKSTTAFIHARDIHVACDRVAGNLHVADEAVSNPVLGPGV